ncbi:Hypothetical protein POVR2_LOCUS374 [uncultured virus]|nr:Hypothetical protein POVR2_LOCUS374 [uncultured virus]
MNMMGLHDSSVIEDACSSTCPSQDISGKTSLNNNPIERQVAVVKLLLADGRIVLTVEELYSCIHAEILQVLLDEQLAASNGTVDPTVESNKPLRQAILRENEGMVRVYLADERVAKLVNAETVRLAKNYSTPAIFELVVKHARLNSGR